MSPQLKKLIEAEAIKMLPGILSSNPAMLKDIILGLASEMKDSTPTKTAEVKVNEEVIETEPEEETEEEEVETTEEVEAPKAKNKGK
jgi:hypothetical protein